MHDGAPLRFTLEGRAVVYRASRLGHPASIPCAQKNGQPWLNLFLCLGSRDPVLRQDQALRAQPAVSPSFRALLVQDG